jgi:hypothetical protein
VPVGHQQHGGVAVAVAASLGGVDQPLDLGHGEVLAGAQVGVRPPARVTNLRWGLAKVSLGSGARLFVMIHPPGIDEETTRRRARAQMRDDDTSDD